MPEPKPNHVRRRPTKTAPFVCTQCAGPCRQYAGSVHGWKCRGCLNAYIAEQKGRDGGGH